MLLEIKDGTVLQNGIPVLSHFDFWIRGNERAAIVGRNGAGKTTLLEVITGAKELEPNPKNPASGLTKARRFTIGTLFGNREYTGREHFSSVFERAF